MKTITVPSIDTASTGTASTVTEPSSARTDCPPTTSGTRGIAARVAALVTALLVSLGLLVGVAGPAGAAVGNTPAGRVSPVFHCYSNMEVVVDPFQFASTDNRVEGVDAHLWRWNGKTWVSAGLLWDGENPAHQALVYTNSGFGRLVNSLYGQFHGFVRTHGYYRVTYNWISSGSSTVSTLWALDNSYGANYYSTYYCKM